MCSLCRKTDRGDSILRNGCPSLTLGLGEPSNERVVSKHHFRMCSIYICIRYIGAIDMLGYYIYDEKPVQCAHYLQG